MIDPVYRAILHLLGGAAILIGAMIFLLGAQQTASIFVAVLSLIAPQPAPEGLADANTDSELRFYSVLWIAYGGCMIHAARNLAARLTLSRILLGIFFAGGVGRLLSGFAAGPPHSLFVILMWVELVLPVLLIGLSFKIKPVLSSELG